MIRRLSFRADSLLFAALSLLILVAPWPWGGNTEAVRSLISLIAGGLLGIWAMGQAGGLFRRPAFETQTRIGLIFWGAWLIWIALQLVPLPPMLLSFISPRSFQYHEQLRTLHAAPLYTVSIAPASTVQGLLDSLGYLSVYMLTLALVRTRERIRTLLLVLLLAGFFQALLAIHLSATGAPGAPVAGTFINRNHFAAYMALTASAGIGLILMDLRERDDRSWRAMLSALTGLLLSERFRNRILVLALIIGVVLSRSRAGNLAFFAALAVAGMLYVILRMRHNLVPALLLFASFLVMDLWVVSRWYGLDKVVERIEQTDIEREQRPMVWQDLVPAIESYGNTGAGLGTFAQAYSPYRSIEVRGFYDHAHNEYAEFLVEVGIPGLCLLGGLVVTHVFHSLRVLVRRRRPVYAGAAFASLMSSIAMLLHASAEFMLRMPAVAMTWVVLLALSVGISAQSSGIARRVV